MTGDFTSLIEAAAYWVQVDAQLRIFWSVIGASVVALIFFLVLAAGGRLLWLLCRQSSPTKDTE